ncbi:MAG TPA: hypothetical protein VMM85_00335, partial [Methylomirabilota bacterium]|nr:hypothetical protein [Methylomirabilota bacterium]
DELRICLLRLRSERIGERLADLQALIGAESQEGDSNDNHELERQFQALSRERELVKQAINAPATVAGERRS